MQLELLELVGFVELVDLVGQELVELVYLEELVDLVELELVELEEERFPVEETEVQLVGGETMTRLQATGPFCSPCIEAAERGFPFVIKKSLQSWSPQLKTWQRLSLSPETQSLAKGSRLGVQKMWYEVPPLSSECQFRSKATPGCL